MMQGLFTRGALPPPRLLPVTIAALALALCLRTADMIRAAAPAFNSAAAAVPSADAPAQPSAPQPPASPPATPAQPASATPVPVPPEAAISDGERALLLDLKQRRSELDAREAGLARRESVLAAAEARLSVRVKELGDLQARLEGLEAKRGERDEANWRSLVKLYENMKPRDAATIFNDLDLAVLLPILDRMKEAKAAAVLAAMQPDRARMVTAELAQMRARANAVPPPAKSDGGG